ncbi:orf114 [Cryptophlebia peltastica nucleopolyhedrovirus]|uniref:Orf114 n=1 Tax=Cryptophlebia peltastica nucleopolyhedrovirus TaxID=2304025 RepID=A0A346RNY3_9ABAC|nr:orf114 [Cryptophlebia peltastica nucleopolyhedrovirus]AXS67780.1 orf114 [Cryptophlebia peltastica nucleopolyhedrovirus]
MSLPLKNPCSLYSLSIKEIKKRILDENSFKDLSLPKVIISDLETLYAEMPPGWYYCPRRLICVVDKDLFDFNIHKEICEYYKQKNLVDFYECINTYVYWRCSDEIPPENDLHLQIDLLQNFIMRFFRLGDGMFIKPWMGGALELSNNRNTKLIKYVEVDDDDDYKETPPSWLKLVKFNDVDQKMLLK